MFRCVSMSQLSKGPYPFWSTDGPILMDDIIDDGLPPDERAGLSEARHIKLIVLVQNVRHLPALDFDGKCDPYVCLSYCDEVYSTQHKEDTLDVNFDETFEFFIHASERTLALECAQSQRFAIGPRLRVECWDYSRWGEPTRVGATDVLLQELFVCQFPMERTIQINDVDGFPVKGSDGQPTTLTLTFNAAEIQEDTARWQPPTLADTLNCSEGKLQLRRAHRSSVKGALSHHVTAARASAVAGDPRRSGVRGDGARMLSEPDAGELQMEELIKTMNQSKKEQLYWRERLNNVMESLAVNIFVMLLILLDVLSIVFFDFVLVSDEADDLEADPPEQWGLTIFVLTSFVLELSLRMIAQQRRFWSSLWNIFDVLIIAGSVVLAIVKWFLEQPGQTSVSVESTYASLLRALSRAAMALRIMRVVINLRKARKLSGNVTQTLRSAVSQNRRRYSKLGFDLDLTYITTRLVAMSAPCFGGHSAYRNDIHIIARFLSLRHYGTFFIFNFCDTATSSDGVIGNYHPQMLFNQVQRIPFEDHGPPLACEMIQFCEEAARWLRMSDKNMVATHCKGGKGRTGVLCSALLLWSGHRRCAMDAMELFTFRRSANYDPQQGFGEADDVGNNPSMWTVLFGKKITYNQGPEGPSQIRYVHYMEAMLYSGMDPLKHVSFVLTCISLPTALCHNRKPWHLSFTITCQRYIVFDSLRYSPSSSADANSSNHMYQGAETGSDDLLTVIGNDAVGTLVTMPVNTVIWGDTRVDFYLWKKGKRKRKLGFFVAFHTSFYQEQTKLSFLKNKVDKLCKNPDIPSDFELSLHLDPDPGHPQLAQETSFRKVFLQHGQPLMYKRHEIVLHERDQPDMLLLITSGSVQGVVHEITGENTSKNQYHALGCVIPAEELGGDKCRRPAIMMLGEGHVIGASQFVSGFGNMEFVARSDTVQVMQLRKTQTLTIKEIDLASSTPLLPALRRRNNSLAIGDEMLSQYLSGDTQLRRSVSARREASMDNMRPLNLQQSPSQEYNRPRDLVRTRSGMSITGSSGADEEPSWKRDKNVTIEDILIEGVPRGQDLYGFYQGLALKLAQKLSLARTESIRLSMLKAFNDRQSVLHLEDELERLKVHAIHTFDLPVNEKILFTSKATYRCLASGYDDDDDDDDGGKRRSSSSFFGGTGGRQIKKIRVIVMSNHLILDPEIFGPTISQSAEVILCNQLHSVSHKSDAQHNTLVLSVQGDIVQGLELVANMRAYEFTFDSLESVQQMAMWLSEMCSKAQEARERLRNKPLESPHMHFLLERCSRVHQLKKGQVLKEGSNSTSLFIVRTGCIKLKREGYVYRSIRQGGCFGSSAFMERCVSGKFTCMASEKTMVLQLPPDVVSAIIEQDPDHGCLFYWTLCQVMDLDFREAMEEMYPGTWSREFRSFR